jgi:hypothetical protein
MIHLSKGRIRLAQRKKVGKTFLSRWRLWGGKPTSAIFGIPELNRHDDQQKLLPVA